ncbi:MAG: sugar transferase, partial [Anaerolineales bacterium]|nr:sugar transferase [Anaerolineales bacterium]
MKRVDRKSRRWRLQVGERRSLLILSDLLAASAATFLALALWAQLDWLGFSWEFVRARAGWFVLLPLIWVILMVNLYDVSRASTWRETIRGVFLAALGGVVLYLAAYFFTEPGSLPRRGVLYFLLLAITFTLILRWGYVRVFTAPKFIQRVLIVGAGESGCALLKVINDMNPPPYCLVGLIDDDALKHGQVIDGVPVLGDNSKLLEIAKRESVSEILVAIQGPMQGEMFQALLDAQERDIQVTRMPVAYEELLGRVPINHLESDWLLRSFVDELRVSAFYLIAKRILDFLGALVGMLIFIMIYPWVALAILIESKRPIIFLQRRLGRGGRFFRVIKFRSMSQNAELNGQAQWTWEGDQRTTKIGRFLRKTHLDETPQFWNVLLGDMSLVGPRPERPELVVELEKKIPFYRARLMVKPGITGWAQVNYGKGAS